MISRTEISTYHTGQHQSIGTANPNLRVQPMKDFAKLLLYIENKKLFLYSDCTKSNDIKMISNQKLQLEFVISNQELSLNSVYIKVKPKTRVAIGKTFKVELVLEGFLKTVENVYRERSTQFTVIVTEDDTKSISFRKAKKEVVMEKDSIPRIMELKMNIEESQLQNQKTEEESHLPHAAVESNNALPLTLSLVVNVVDPIKGERRSESVKTTERINEIFSNIANWQIKGLINPTRKHFFKDIEGFIQDSPRKFDQIVTIIMSHGDHRYFSLTDGDIVQTELVKTIVKITGDSVLKVFIFTNCLTSNPKEAVEEMTKKIQVIVEETNNLMICFPCAPGQVSGITKTKKKECHNLYIHTLLKRFKKLKGRGCVIHLEDVIKGTERRVQMVNITKKDEQNECNVKEIKQVSSDINANEKVEGSINQIPWSAGKLLKPFIFQKKPSPDGDNNL